MTWNSTKPDFRRPAACPEAGSAFAIEALAKLTPREREVLDWLCECKRDSEIAQILGISPYTVGKHLQAVFRKFGVENRVGAVRCALDARFQAPKPMP